MEPSTGKFRTSTFGTPVSLSFSSDSRTLICRYRSGTVRLWPRNLDEQIDLAARHAGRELIEEEPAAYEIPQRLVSPFRGFKSSDE